jgi:exodeoxyribonuclease VII large subunit
MDTTLTDLVADLRAPTPSAAAEKAVPDVRDVQSALVTFRTHLSWAAGGRLEAAAGRLALVRSRMSASVTRRTQRAGHTLRDTAMRMATSCVARFERLRSGAEKLGASLDALSPLKVLDRGFSVARDEAGRVLKRTPDFPPGKRFRLRLADGEVKARAEGGS